MALLILLALVFTTILPALFLWEVAAIKVNVRLPKAARKRLFKLGARFALVAVVFEMLEHAIPLHGVSPLGKAYFGALFAAIPEELVKCAAVYRFGRRELDQIGPGIAILLAVGASLGFAVLEDKGYVAHGNAAGVVIWVMRAVSAIPMHAVFGFTMGSFLAIAWRDYKGTDHLMVALALFVPMSFHFAYDFLLMLHAADRHLAWPMEMLPLLMIFEAGFALILTNHAVHMPTSLYGAREPVDRTGSRAMTFAIMPLVAALLVLGLVLTVPGGHAMEFGLALPIIFALDMGVTAMARRQGYA